jgi:uncharacterized protein YbjQ (UPF0145 family)
MKLPLQVSLAALLVSFSLASHGRDDVGKYSITDTLSLEKAKETLGTDVRFYFGDQPHGNAVKKFGEFRTNKKTNAFNKSDREACEWAFLSAMKSLRDRALSEGGNAVVNIRSNYKNNTTSSSETFDCGAGKVIAGVALIGDVVTLQ